MFGIILLLIFSINFVNCLENLCNYLIKNFDTTFDLCLSNECNKYLDPYVLSVKPNDCKTHSVYLSFSSFQTYELFLNRIQWKLSNLFPKKSQQIRLLRIYLNQIDSNDYPTHENHLNRLGNHIDIYQLYIQNLTTQNSLQRFIHYDPNDPQWFIIKIRFICNSLIQYDEEPCTTHIVSPSLFAPQRPKTTLPLPAPSILPLLTTLTNQKSNQENERSIHLILLILVPLGILFITIILSFLVYRHLRRNECSQTDVTLSSISHNLDTNNREQCECRGNIRPYQVSRLPSPHQESLYKET
ncbi:hypothetical protein I4U23_004755 [Adineta vaga]|nr:hypothetical protein I4U23_004755 [Adineta vaga]